ncbi:hypothetical protein YPPY91_2810, partial [Yersinia pestis PY-91]
MTSLSLVTLAADTRS